MIYKGYKVIQALNHHVLIIDGERLVFHSMCNHKCTEKELAEFVDFYLEIPFLPEDESKK